MKKIKIGKNDCINFFFRQVEYFVMNYDKKIVKNQNREICYHF